MSSESKTGQRAASQEAKTKRDHVVGLVVVGVAFALAVAISHDSHGRSQPVFSQEPEPPTKQGVPGFPNQVDVLQGLEKARALTPRQHLARIHALGVRANGSVDLTQAGARVQYLFRSKEGEGPVPERPPGTLARRRYCGQQAVDITSAGIGARPDRADRRCEPEFRSVPTPECGPKELWELAKSKGASDAQRAKVEYTLDEQGPVWKFRIEGTEVEFTTRGDCRTPVGE